MGLTVPFESKKCFFLEPVTHFKNFPNVCHSERTVVMGEGGDDTESKSRVRETPMGLWGNPAHGEIVS